VKVLNRRGFTLIELLVVIAIIAILAAILFPVFGVVKERGRQASCVNNQKQLWQAFQQYLDDYNGRMPVLSSTTAGAPPDWCGSPWVGQQVNPAKGQLWPYTKNKRIYLCPTDKGIPAVGIRNFALSYSVNNVLDRQILESAVSGRASRVLFLMHEGRQSVGPCINDGFFCWQGGVDLPDKIHFDGTTTCYCDGHVKWLSFKEMDRIIKTTNQWLRNDQGGTWK
jgi:prepilin-type N-terminal cleavage/methylation domain-containing protein